MAALNDLFNTQWVRGDLENPLVVLATVLATLMPWQIGTFALGGFRVMAFRWPLFQLHWINFDRFNFITVLEAINMQSGNSVVIAYQIWAVSGFILAASTLYGAALFLAEDTITAYYRPARVAGALLGASTIGFTASLALFYLRGAPGLRIPIGLLFTAVFAGILLTNTPDSPPTPDSDTDSKAPPKTNTAGD